MLGVGCGLLDVARPAPLRLVTTAPPPRHPNGGTGWISGEIGSLLAYIRPWRGAFFLAMAAIAPSR